MEKESPDTEKVMKRRGKSTGETFPRNSLKESLKISQAIAENNAGKPWDRLLIANATGWSPNSSGFRKLITSSNRYGLTNGGYNAPTISLTQTGMSIVKPTTDREKESALKTALLAPPLFKRILEHYNKNQLPNESIFKNNLERTFGVDNRDVESAYNVLMTNLEDFGLIKLISGKNYIMINNIETVDLPLVSEEEKVLPNEEPPEVQSTAIEKTPEKQKQVFVAHGKNKKPLEQLEKILSKFKVKYKVAIDEPNSGRPIGEKVAELMKQCTSAIFIFTADEESRDADGNTVYRPSDNVVFELGAGTMLYGRKIVIFREESTKFGSDFTAFGHITFEKDKLDAKGTELLQELVEQGFLTINVP